MGNRGHFIPISHIGAEKTLHFSWVLEGGGTPIRLPWSMGMVWVRLMESGSNWPLKKRRTSWAAENSRRDVERYPYFRVRKARTLQIIPHTFIYCIFPSWYLKSKNAIPPRPFRTTFTSITLVAGKEWGWRYLGDPCASPFGSWSDEVVQIFHWANGTRWWFDIFFIFTPNLGEDSHFD